MHFDETFICCLLLLRILSESFCWGTTDSQGHCTGLGTSPRDVGYEPFGVFNTIASSRRFASPWIIPSTPPIYMDTSRMDRLNWNTFVWDRKRFY